MSEIVLTCPIDGLSVATAPLSIGAGTRTEDYDGDFVRDPTQHVHMPFRLRGVCANAHAWQAEGELTVERVTRETVERVR